MNQHPTLHERLQVLLVEDSPEDAEYIEWTLRQGGYEPRIERVQTANDFMRALERGGWQVVISDFALPTFNGLSALRLMRDRNIDLPFIIVSGTVGEEVAVEVMRCGASDYLMKGNLVRLVPSVRREVDAALGRLRRRLAEAALQLRDFAVNQAPDPMLTIDERLAILTANETASRRFGWSRDNLTHMTIDRLDARSDDGPWLTALAAARLDGRAVIERVVLAADGTVFPVEVSLSHFRYDNQDLWCCFLRDITERRRAESELHRAKAEAEEASRAKSEFLANMSHELRTPLTGVLGMAELLYEDAVGNDQREQIEAILTSGKSLLAIINDLLDLSKVEAGRLELECLPCDLRQLSEEVLELVRPRTAGHPVQLILEAAPDFVIQRLADPVRVRQILLNLVGNAVKFTDHGSVTVRFSNGAAPGLVRCSVCDTGIGISAEQQIGLFQPFAQADMSTTRRFGGTGLGLAIVRRLAERMGGSVGMTSGLGEGSTFWVELPLPVLEPAAGAPAAGSPAGIPAPR